MTVPVSVVSSQYDLEVDFLEVLVAAMTSTEAGAPDRAFVSPGQPAFDTSCDQACVFSPLLAEEGTAPTGPPMQLGSRFHAGRVNLVSLAGFMIRCAPVSEGNQQPFTPLTDVSLNQQAKKVAEDGWASWNVLTKLLKDGTLFGGHCADVHFDGVLPLVPQGGLIGCQLNIRVWLYGYVPDFVFPPTGLGG